MTKSILSIAYAVSLFVSAAAHSVEASQFQAVAEDQARQAVAVARQQIREELEQSMRPARVTAATRQVVLTGGVEVVNVTRARNVAAE